MVEYNAYIAILAKELPIRIDKVIDRIREKYSKEIFETRITGDKTHNEHCNRAIGMVGHHFAKHLGWINVLKIINDKY